MPSHRTLIINPNTTTAMTDALKPLVQSLNYADNIFDAHTKMQTTYTFFTAPSGVPSINNEHDGAVSAAACLPALQQDGYLSAHDAFLVACYSPHPLVPQLRAALAAKGAPKPVAGIFDASIATCLQLLDFPDQQFGIVSTGAQWSGILDAAVQELLGARARYVGTETTGMNADQLHALPAKEVEAKMREATKRLLRKGAKAVCLGCAGMVGLDAVVRKACVEELGEEGGRAVRIVDGVVAGVCFLEGMLRARP